MERYFLGAFGLVWILFIILSRTGAIPLFSDRENELIWGLVLAPIFCVFWLVYFYFKKDDFS
jgi:hypothetical protein